MTEDSFLRDLKGFARRLGLFTEKDTILVAVSGGIDSMVLLDALWRLREEFAFSLAVAHMNYRLRGEASDADEELVRAAAGERHLECHVERLVPGAVKDLQAGSLQQDARALRYEFFSRTMRSSNYTKTATGHHADDNAETILFNFLRGSGVHGLTGIPVRRADIPVIRPLLFAGRAEIARYAAASQVRYREDATNSRNDYARNFLRNEVIPGLRERINPGLSATLARTGELFRKLERHLEEETAALAALAVISRTADEIVIDTEALRGVSPFLLEYLLLKTAREFTGGDWDRSQLVKSMMDVLSGGAGARCSIGEGSFLSRDRRRLVFGRAAETEPFCYTVECGTDYDFEEFRFSIHEVAAAEFTGEHTVEYADAGKLAPRMIIRTWREGDWFVPLGMTEKKKLSDFFVEQKIPLLDKARVPLLESEGSIVWVLGRRLDDRCKVTPATRRIIKLIYEPRRKRT